MSTAVEGNRQSNWRGTSFCEVDLTKFKAIDIPSHRFIPLTSDHMNISKVGQSLQAIVPAVLLSCGFPLSSKLSPGDNSMCRHALSNSALCSVAGLVMVM